MYCHRPTMAIICTIWGHIKWKRSWKSRIRETLMFRRADSKTGQPWSLRLHPTAQMNVLSSAMALSQASSRAVCWQKSAVALSWSIIRLCASLPVLHAKLVVCTRLYLYEHMRLTASIKHRKKVCAYEKMCAYEKGALNNPSLWYTADLYYDATNHCRHWGMFSPPQALCFTMQLGCTVLHPRLYELSGVRGICTSSFPLKYGFIIVQVYVRNTSWS